MPQFLILARDYKDDGALARRHAIREAHLQRMQLEKTAGRFITGGAKLNEDGNMYGSMLVVHLPNEEAVKQWLKDDPYVTGKVWEEIEILPFKLAEV